MKLLFIECRTNTILPFIILQSLSTAYASLSNVQSQTWDVNDKREYEMSIDDPLSFQMALDSFESKSSNFEQKHRHFERIFDDIEGNFEFPISDENEQLAPRLPDERKIYTVGIPESKPASEQSVGEEIELESGETGNLDTTYNAPEATSTGGKSSTASYFSQITNTTLQQTSASSEEGQFTNLPFTQPAFTEAGNQFSPLMASTTTGLANKVEWPHTNSDAGQADTSAFPSPSNQFTPTSLSSAESQFTDLLFTQPSFTEPSDQLLPLITTIGLANKVEWSPTSSILAGPSENVGFTRPHATIWTATASTGPHTLEGNGTLSDALQSKPQATRSLDASASPHPSDQSSPNEESPSFSPHLPATAHVSATARPPSTGAASTPPPPTPTLLPRAPASFSAGDTTTAAPPLPLASVVTQVLTLPGLEALGPVRVLYEKIELGVPSATVETVYAPFEGVRIVVPPGAWVASRRRAEPRPLTVTVFYLPKGLAAPGTPCGPALDLGPHDQALALPILVSLPCDANGTRGDAGRILSAYRYEHAGGWALVPPRGSSANASGAGSSGGDSAAWAEVKMLGTHAALLVPAEAGVPALAAGAIVGVTLGAAALAVAAGGIARRLRRGVAVVPASPPPHPLLAGEHRRSIGLAFMARAVGAPADAEPRLDSVFTCSVRGLEEFVLEGQAGRGTAGGGDGDDGCESGGASPARGRLSPYAVASARRAAAPSSPPSRAVAELRRCWLSTPPPSPPPAPDSRWSCKPLLAMAAPQDQGCGAQTAPLDPWRPAGGPGSSCRIFLTAEGSPTPSAECATPRAP
jgi:hypothetical protein